MQQWRHSKKQRKTIYKTKQQNNNAIHCYNKERPASEENDQREKNCRKAQNKNNRPTCRVECVPDAPITHTHTNTETRTRSRTTVRFQRHRRQATMDKRPQRQRVRKRWIHWFLPSGINEELGCSDSTSHVIYTYITYIYIFILYFLLFISPKSHRTLKLCENVSTAGPSNFRPLQLVFTKSFIEIIWKKLRDNVSLLGSVRSFGHTIRQFEDIF